MNHIYRSIWNASTGTVVAVSENAKCNGKKAASGRNAVVSPGFILRSVAAAVALALGSNSHAAPEGGTVVAGNASILRAPDSTTISQTTQNVAINWQSFDIGVTEAVRFVQPNSNAVALNRVLGADPSSILGSLSANGKVFLINPNGVLFGTGAQVNVGGLVASTRNITDGDFLAGRYTFSGASNAGVLNQGTINADGGYVALLGANVSNQGVIAAKLGSVALAAGDVLTLDVAGDGLLNVTVHAGSVDALVQNGGLIQADGGHVLLTARSASNLLQSAVNNSGVIQAQTIENHNGVIKLLGDMQSGTANVGGTLDASAPNGGDGGFIDTSAAQVKVANTAKVTTAAARGLTGSWLIDPADYTIAASGGDITGAQLSDNLVDTNITIQSIAGGAGTAGDVNVNDTVTWSANQLTLSAQNDININTAMHASGTASLALQYGQGAIAAGNTATVNVNAPVDLPSGNTLSKQLGSDGAIVSYTVINSLGAQGSTTGTDLQGMSGNLAGNYALGANIDATATSGWNGGAGFAPIGNQGTKFTGVFDGLGHTVSGVFINRVDISGTGLFGITAAGSFIRNVGLLGGSVASNTWATGSLVGILGGTIYNSYATGSVSGHQTVGGLVGNIDGGAIIASHATGDVVAYGNGEAGGLVGLIWGALTATVSDSYATGNVSSPVGNVGGLVGINWRVVTNSYATGTASGTNYVGGLIGNNSIGSIANSYATGVVSGNNNVGGLVGSSSNSIINSHATGAVTGNDHVGGLAGVDNGTNSNNYATGSVTGRNAVGGLVGYGSGTVTNGHATGSVTGTQGYVGGLVGYVYYGTVTNSHATGPVTGTQDYVGGLVGYSYYGTVTNSHATGAVLGRNQTGGLLGYNYDGSVINSYAAGAVTGNEYVGGLVGRNYGTVGNSYASGAVQGFNRVGGLIGANHAAVSNTYATGLVQSANTAGGLMGVNFGSVTNSFWNTETSGHATGNTGTGLTSFQMMQLASFSSWNTAAPNTIASTGSSGASWRIYEGQSAPLLTQFLTPLTLTNSDVVTYNGTAQTGVNVPSGVLGGGTNAGLYSFYSNQQGYDITGGTLTINQAALTLGSGTVTKTYDGDLTASSTALVIAGTLFGTDAISGGTFAFTDKDAGSDKTVTTAGVTVVDGNNGGNYNVSYADNITSTITPAVLTATVVVAAKDYDGSTGASVTLDALTGLVGSETLGASGTATFDSKDVIDASLVTVNSVALTDGTNGGIASNYSLASGQTVAANITARTLTATVTAPDKVYDGNTSAAATLSALSGLVGTETLDASGAATFNSKDVASANLVTVNSVTLSNGTNGGLASNYSLAGGQTVEAHIVPKVLTVAGQVAQDKEYDGTTTATLSGGSLVGVIAGETVVLVEAGTFATADVGDAIPVTAADSLSGMAAANYTISQPTGLVANITAAAQPEIPPVDPPPVDPPIDTPPVDIPPPDVTATAEFASAVGHVAATAQVAPTSVSATLSLGPAASVSTAAGSMTYDLTGLDLTVIARDIELPSGVQSRDGSDEEE